MEPETILQNKCIAELNRRGHFARNHTVGQFYTKYGSIVRVGVPGESDIDGFRKGDGKAFYIEIKMPGKKPREDQLAFLKAVEDLGAIGGWATSVEECIKIVEGTE